MPSDEQNGPSSRGASVPDVRTCRECDTFGEDRCSIHAKLSVESGYRRMSARYGGVCRVCKNSFAKNDTIFWAPEHKPMCEACGKSAGSTTETRDSEVGALSKEQRIQMIKLLDTMGEIERAAKPWNAETQDRFETTLAELYGQFRNVAKVKAFIERHMDELKSIPAKLGFKHSRPLIARRSDVCRICDKRTASGELIWWSPSEPLMCFDCGRGRDPALDALSIDDRDKLTDLLNRAREFEELGDNRTPEQQSSYDALLITLYSRFRKVVQVKRLLIKHMDSLKAIAGRHGRDNARTVLAKQEHSCLECHRAIGKGEVVWWAPDAKRLCFDCGQLEQRSDVAVSPEYDAEQLARARELLEQLKRLDEQQPANLPPAWAAKWADEKEDVLIELYCDLRHIDEVRAVLYEHFTELCAIASQAG